MMYKKEYRLGVFVFTILFLVFCFNVRNSWSLNYTPNVHWAFCIDTSGSMKEKGHIDLLRLITKKIITDFIDTKKNIIKKGDRITIFSFDEEARFEATAIYQTENDILPIKNTLIKLNNRSGNLTFISEAIVQAMDIIGKYDQFFHTSALFVFTDGKSEPYSPKWTAKKIKIKKTRDRENLKKISLLEKDHELNIWLGVLKWDAFEDATSFVKKIGKGGHLIDLTDFNRLSLEKALRDFAQTVRSNVKLNFNKDIDFGTIPYRNSESYQKKISFGILTDKISEPPAIKGEINFEPDNPSEIAKAYPIKIKTTEDKMVLNFKMPESNELKPGTYKGKLKLFPSKTAFGTVVIEPSQFNVQFKKSGFASFIIWRFLTMGVLGILFLMFAIRKIKRKMPIKV